MKKLLYGSASLALAFLMTSPAGAQPMPAPAMGMPGNADFQFARAVQAGNDREMSDARYVLTMSKNPRIRAFANAMISDHSQANVSLQRAARSGNVPLPQMSRATRKMMAPLAFAGLAEPALDAAYMKAQVEGHTRMLALVQNYLKTGTNLSLKGYAENLEPTVQKHLDTAGNIVAAMDDGTMRTGATTMSGTPAPSSPVPAPQSTSVTGTNNTTATPMPMSSASSAPGAPATPVGSSPPTAPQPSHAP